MSKWIESINEELESLEENKTFLKINDVNIISKENIK